VRSARQGRILQSGLAGIKFAATTVLLSGLLATIGQANAADLSLVVTGNLLGSVVDGVGTPQMGATVQLLNRYERVLAKAITATDGRFVFAGLPLDTYAVRVSQPSFLPAFRDRITIKPGVDSILQIHLATLFSNIQVSYKMPTGAMTNDWKWALRTSAATRPVTRYLPELTQKRGEAGPRAQIFSDTHAMLRLNGGDAGMIDTGAATSDLGSIFALSTNLFGKNQVQIAGSLGQSSDFMPTVRGLAAVYQRSSQNSFLTAPEVTLTVSQFSRFGTQFPGTGQALGLRVMSLNLYQASDPTDNLHLEYGVTGQSVSYLQESTRISPFARATIMVSPDSQLIAAYSDGGRPDELMAHSATHLAEQAYAPDSELANAVNALGRLPQMSSRQNHLVLQRTQNYELGLTRRIGSRTYAISGFHEEVWNGQLNLSGNVSMVSQGNLLFDGMSKTSTYNIGDYTRTGYAGSVTQRLSDHTDFAVAFGRMGGMSTADPSHMFGSALPLLQMGLHDVAGAKFRASIPAFGTRFTAGYGWVDSKSFVPVHVFVTQSNIVSPGLNFGFQQPIPTLFGFPGHIEITADLRNLLAQGYIPVGASGPGQLLVVQSPRAIRGGLNFTF
jgi:hypothetical protein